MRVISFEPAPLCYQVPVINATPARAASLLLPINFGKLFLLCLLFTLFFSASTAVETAENIEQAEADLATVTAAIIDIQTWLSNANA
ncbi:MAG TPA: hypothetical protein DCS89_13610, partial [Gammaproteobacteria bacterium]|nr:hypothetical protein [Gammaproteobacteria bacterium]